MRKVAVACLGILLFAGVAWCDDEIDNTFQKVDKYLYGIDNQSPPPQQETPQSAPQPQYEQEDAPPPAPAPAPVASAPPQAGGYLGCFKDESRRDLKEKEFSDGKMTPAMCIDFCREEGFPFAGVQYGSHCFCGNRYGKYGQIPEKNCKSACSGDSDLDCGGAWANSVYAVGKPALQAAPAPQAAPPVAGATALGCYKDESRRDLKEKETSDGKMTPAKCINFCREEGFQFAGVQYGSHCFCGNRYGKYGKIPEKKCKMACSGDSDLDCGGSWANFVCQLR